MGSAINHPKQGHYNALEKQRAVLARLGASAARLDPYNFHPRDLIDSLTSTVGSHGHRPVVLSGERGAGRGYLLSAVVDRLRAGGMNIALLHASLEGYEPDQEMAAFLRYKTQKHGPLEPGGLASSLGEAGSGGEWAALLVALVYGCSTADLDLQSIAKEGSAWPGGEARDKVFHLIKRLTEDRRIVLHLTNGCSISDPILEALSAEAEINSRLLLAISTPPANLASRVQLDPLRHSTSFTVARLTPDQMQAALDRNFGPNIFTTRFYQLMWRASGGLPMLAAVFMYDFVDRELVDCNPEAGRPVSDSAACAELENYIASVSAAGWLLRGEDREAGISRWLPQYLFLAGLCQENIPAKLILEYLGLVKESADESIDFIDEQMVESTGLFTDFQYDHPSFSKLAVYQFPDSLALQMAFDCVRGDEGARLATGFLDFLKKRFRVTTRGACSLLLSVALKASPGPEVERFQREAAWWVARTEASDLTDLLDRAVSANQLASESIWSIFDATANRWPSYRRLALLEAYRRHPTSIPRYRAGEIGHARAQLLKDLGRDDEAIEAARDTLTQLERDRPQWASAIAGCHTLLAASYAEAGESEKARRHLELAVEASFDITEKSNPTPVAIFHELAGRLRAFGENRTAKLILERAIETTRKLYGLIDERALDLLKSLSDVLQEMNEIEGAGRCLEQALEISRALYGSTSVEITVILKRLVQFLLTQGHPELARGYLEEDLLIETAAYGEEDARVAVLRSTLTDLLIELGEFEAARSHLRVSLEAVERESGRESEAVSMLLKHLADLSWRVGDLEASRDFLQRALSIDETLYGSANPQVSVQLKRLADVFWKLGDAQGSILCLKRALSIEEEIYGSEDPRIVPNLAYLEAFVRKTGDLDVADGYLQRLHSLRSLGS